MRRNVTKCLAIRGGHGWDRPDVPLTVPYEHKRIVLYILYFRWMYSIQICGSTAVLCQSILSIKVCIQ